LTWNWAMHWFLWMHFHHSVMITLDGRYDTRSHHESTLLVCVGAIWWVWSAIEYGIIHMTWVFLIFSRSTNSSHYTCANSWIENGNWMHLYFLSWETCENTCIITLVCSMVWNLVTVFMFWFGRIWVDNETIST
jgi:hypothetical protein